MSNLPIAYFNKIGKSIQLGYDPFLSQLANKSMLTIGRINNFPNSEHGELEWQALYTEEEIKSLMDKYPDTCNDIKLPLDKQPVRKTQVKETA